MLHWLLKHFWSDPRSAFERWQQDDGGLMAAAVAFYAALSVFPFLILLFAVASYFLSFTNFGQDVQHQLLTAIGQQTSPALQNQVADALGQVQRKAVIGGPLGILGVLMTSLIIFNQFDRAFDRIWNTPAPPPAGIVAAIRRILMQRLKAFLILAFVGTMLMVVFLSGMVLATIQSYTEGVLPFNDSIWWFIQVGASVMLNTVSLTVLYKLLPRVQLRWSEAARGGLVAAVVWEIGRLILAWVVIGGKFTSAYGVIGSFIAVMLWIYYAISVIFIGAEYVQVICEKCEPQE